MARALVAVLLTLSAQIGATSMTVRVAAMPTASPPDRLDMRLSIWQTANSVSPVAVRDVLITKGEARTEVTLVPGAYVVQAEAAGFWAPPQGIEISAAHAANIDLKMWRTNGLVFELLTPDQRAPKEVRVQFRGTPASPEKARVPAGHASCTFDSLPSPRLVTCPIPLGIVDIRLMAISSSGVTFIPEYLWDVENRVDPDPPAIRLSLASGSSLTGYVRNEQAEPAMGARLELRTPSGKQIEPGSVGLVEPSIRAYERGLPHLRATTNKRGFFQIRETTPGEYRIVATGETGAYGHTTVTLDQGRETALRDFLSLEKPYEVRVTIDPPTHPVSGDPWSIRLLRVAPLTNEARYTVGYDGSTVLDGVGRGAYTLTVSAAGQRYFHDSFDVEEQPGPVHIRIPFVRVIGKVTIGAKPLRATLTFGGERGPRSVSMEAGETGEFSGILPREGKWILQIDATEPPVHRVLREVAVTKGDADHAEVKIALKDGGVKGRVVDESGNPVGFALIQVTPFDSLDDWGTSYTADESGTFVLRGLSPQGRVALEAHSPDLRASEPVLVTISEDGAEVTLVVTEHGRLVGRIVSAASSQPLPGATVVALRAANKPLTVASRATSDADGRFNLRLPPNTTAVSLAYWADGYSVEMMEVATVGNLTNPITLTASPIGGTLLVELPESTTSGEKHLLPVLVHRGASMSPQGLVTIRPGPRPLEAVQSRMSVPNMAPGEYILCVMDARAFQLGLSPRVDPSNCAYGMLLPGGELRLSLTMKPVDAVSKE